MAKRVGVDKWLFGTVLLLGLFGLVMVFSASAVMSQAEWGSPYKYVAKQGIYALLGMLALFGLMRVDYRKYNNYPVVVSAIALTTVLLLAVFAMHGQFGAHRWIQAGGVTLQPSEIAKPVRHMVVTFVVHGGHADHPGLACQVKVGNWAGAVAVVATASASRKR